MSLYLPSHFGVADPEVRDALARELIAAHPFATMIGVRDGGPFVTHCPMIAQPSPDASAGFVLEGHVARANPHWQLWQGGAGALAIFHGPHAYVSPSLYERRENVPTWNYAIAHVSGPAVAIDDADAKHALLKRLIRAVEPAYEAHWNELDAGYQERMLSGIVGLRILVDGIEAKFKVSQNRLPVDRERVFAAFSEGDEAQRSLAQWMRRLGV